MNKIIYKGPFKEYIEEHVELKQAVGYKYDTEAARLKQFDEFTLERYPNASSLTKEITLEWCSKKSYEARANQLSRASIIRQFGKYLDSIGVKSYILPKGYYPKEKQYMPHIYVAEELASFFAETDRCKYSCECPYRHLIMPVIFRMLYSCGLRLSEARLLKVADVDLINGVLSVLHAKKDNNRLVPMSNSLTQRCRSYSKKVRPRPVTDQYFFPGLHGMPITGLNLYHNFRRFLWRAKISHGGKGVGPRIHDFRHTFAVHCLKKWSEQGLDLAVYLPVLKTYMGHNSFRDTAYYLHLTADVFPDITQKLEIRYPGIIPECAGGQDETL